MKARITQYPKTKKIKNRWNIVFDVLLTSLIIFIVLFATPIIGSFSAHILFENALGCDVTSGIFDNHNTAHTCLFYGWDVSDKVAAYSTPIFSFFMTPFSFLAAFADVLLVWILMIFIAHKKSSPSPDNRNILNNIIYYIFFLFPFILMLLILLSPATNRVENHQHKLDIQIQQQVPVRLPKENQYKGIRL